MITPQQGMSFMQQMQALQRPGGAGIGAPPAGSPTQGLIARLMSDNPGGLIGALMKQNDPNQPGSMASRAPGMALPAPPPGGVPPMAPGAAPGPMPAPVDPGRLTANSSNDDVWNSYKAAGGGADLSNNQFVQNSQNAGGMFGGGGGMGMLGGLLSKLGFGGN